MRALSTILFLSLSLTSFAQKAELIKLDQLKALMEKKTEKIQVINFWATWCVPCIKEMPLLERVNSERTDVEVSLISMDLDLDPDPAKVHRFVERKQLKSRVFILNETNPNSWIDKIEKDWSGALPATIVINTKTGKRSFVEGQLKEGELEALIDKMKN